MCEQNFLPVGLHVSLILNRLRNERVLRELQKPEIEKIENGADRSKTKDDEERQTKERLDYVNRRLRELNDFEKRYGRRK
jgi:hypothetical protein